MIQVFRDCGYPVKVHSFPGVELVDTPNLPGRRGLEDSGAAQQGGMTEILTGREIGY